VISRSTRPARERIEEAADEAGTAVDVAVVGATAVAVAAMVEVEGVVVAVTGAGIDQRRACSAPDEVGDSPPHDDRIGRIEGEG
jgi:hypothetical protein